MNKLSVLSVLLYTIDTTHNHTHTMKDTNFQFDKQHQITTINFFFYL